MSQQQAWRARAGGTFAALHHTDFRLFWSAVALSAAGQTLWRGTQNWQILQLTDAPFALGLAGFMSTFPSLLLALFAGAISDNVPKRTILLIAHGAYAAGVALLALLTGFRIIELWHILVLALSMGIVSAFWFPTRQASVPELLPKEQVMNGIALNSTGFYTASFAGAAALGWLLSVGGIHGAYVVASGVFVFAVVSLRAAHWDPQGKAEPGRRFIWNEVVRGLAYIRSNRVVLTLLGATAVGSVFHSAPQVLMPVFARDILDVGEQGYGYLTAANTLGSFFGALTLASLGDYRGKGLLILTTLVIQGVSQTLFGLSGNFYLSLMALTFNGIASALHISALITVIQLASPPEFRGRIMGLYFLVFQGLAPIGSLYTGTVAQLLTAPFAVVFGGIALMLAGLGLLWRSTDLRRFS